MNLTQITSRRLAWAKETIPPSTTHLLYEKDVFGINFVSVPVRFFLSREVLVERFAGIIPENQLPKKGAAHNFFETPVTEKSADNIELHLRVSHLTVDSIAKIGVPRFDLESLLQKKTEITLTGEKTNASAIWVVSAILAILRERSDKDLESEIKNMKDNAPSTYARSQISDFSVRLYKIGLAKTLLYIEQLGLGGVDWSVVSSYLPENDVKLDIDEDSKEGSFFIYAAAR